MMKVIVLEDEIPAFNKLSKYLLEYNPNAKIINWYRSIESALIEKENFENADLILSDIKLLDGNSIELFLKFEVNCPIIFCTAYSKYLKDAFETNGIAYLIKPYSQTDFNKALNKYEQFFGHKHQPDIKQKQDSIAIIEHILKKNVTGYKQRFSIKRKDGIIIKPTQNILSFKAHGDFCTLISDDNERHHINYKISQIEEVLDPDQFFRINRSEIININYIIKVETHFKNKMQITLLNQSTVMTSGTRTPEFRQWLDGK